MSASLVGSEMCIRDRAKKARGKAEIARGNAKRARGEVERARGKAEGTVSYTHLTLPTICSV
eukprot:3331036-Alexandrium_andersonii.AAC.1